MRADTLVTDETRASDSQGADEVTVRGVVVVKTAQLVRRGIIELPGGKRKIEGGKRWRGNVEKL